MATPSKTDAQSLLALQNVATGSVLISSTIDVSTVFAIALAIWVGRTSNTAPTTALSLRLEANLKASGVGFWVPTSFTPASSINAITSQAVNGTCNASQAVVPMAATAGESLSDLIYIKNSTIANGEFGTVKTITTNTSVTIEDNLNNAQTGSTVYPNAQRFLAMIDCSAFKHLRLVVNNNNGGVGFDVLSYYVTLDSIG